MQSRCLCPARRAIREAAAPTRNEALWRSRQASQRRRFGQQPTHITDRLSCARSSHKSINRLLTRRVLRATRTRRVKPFRPQAKYQREMKPANSAWRERRMRLFTHQNYLLRVYEYILVRVSRSSICRTKRSFISIVTHIGRYSNLRCVFVIVLRLLNCCAFHVLVLHFKYSSHDSNRLLKSFLSKRIRQNSAAGA